MEERTNVVRILDKLKIDYKFHSYIDSNAISGVDVAKYLNQDENRVFINFGSRVNLFLPIGTKVYVKLGDRTTGGMTHVADLPDDK